MPYPCGQTMARTNSQEHAQPPVGVLLHGAPRLRLPGGEVPLHRKAAGLIAYLNVNGSVPRSRIATLFWPGLALPAARNNPRQALFKVRRQAGAEIVAGDEALSLAPGLQLETHARGARFLDTCTFEDCPEIE